MSKITHNVCRNGGEGHSLQQTVVNKLLSLTTSLSDRVGQHSAAAYAAQTRAHIWCALFGQFQYFIGS